MIYVLVMKDPPELLFANIPLFQNTFVRCDTLIDRKEITITDLGHGR